MTNTASLLRRVRSRIAATTAVEDLQVGAAFGGAAALAVLVAGRLRWIDGDMAWPAATAVGVAVLFPLAGLLVRRTDARVIAARADEKLGLRERLSTSLWLGGTPTAEPLGGLVVADADAAAAAVASADIARAFRPRLLRRPLVAAGVAALGCAGLLLWQPVAQAVESPQQKAARLAEQNRAAEVAKKLEEAAKKVEEAATERKEETLAKVALEIKRAAQEMQRDPPQREAALTKLNKLADKTQAEARRKAGMKEALSAPETSAQDKQLEQLLQDMANAGLESLAKDLAELQQKLKDNPSGDGAPSAEDMRALANRMDALRRAIQRAEESGARDLAQSLRKLANDDVLAKIGQRLRSLAARLDARGYQGLASEGDSEGMDLSEMSREELEQLLKDLDELAGMEDLEKLLREGGAEARGGKKLRFRPGGAGGT